MPLTPGTRLGHYQVTAAIGAGGMGEVYRATDTRLGREVALKVLPDAFARDPGRLARFEHEARLLAALNHPNIAAIYGLEEAASATPGAPVRFLVLELVPGETLAERIARGPLPVGEALSVCRQIAEGLEAAHERGVIHRDLKPANVKVTPEGQVKVLDFGLAKAFGVGEASPGVASLDPSQSPTLTTPATQAGMILGTAAYMSPEQARGRPVDKRADVWSFGCVLYEALTGRQAFSGESITDILAAVVKEEPDWGRLPAETPPSVRRLLQRCLAKEPRNRLRDIGDADWKAAAEEGARSGPGHAGSRVTAYRRARILLAGALFGAAVVAGVAWPVLQRLGQTTTGTRPVARLSIRLPQSAVMPLFGWPRSSLAISPDGMTIVYRGVDRYQGYLGPVRLYVRRLDDLTPRPLAGTEYAHQPFFSPDGRWVAFFNASGELRKIRVDGGQAVALTRGIRASPWSFGAWGDDGIIVFSEWESGLFEVPADGGRHRALTSVAGSERHHEPEVLPGSKAILFVAFSPDKEEIRVLRRDDGRQFRLLENAGNARFLTSGDLLFTRDGALMTVRFDPGRLEVLGPPVPLPLNVRMDSVQVGNPKAQMAASRTGTLVYAPAAEGFLRSTRFVWVDRRGSVREAQTAPVSNPVINLSKDGRRLLVADMSGSTQRIQVLDLERGTLDPVARSRQLYMTGALWSPDGAIIYAQTDAEGAQLLAVHTDSGRLEELLRLPGMSWLAPYAVSAGGRVITYMTLDSASAGDIWLLRADGDPGHARPVPFLNSPAHERQAALSPDGRWIVYGLHDMSEAGKNTAYLRRFPDGALKQAISSDGARCLMWSPTGREIYYQLVGRPPAGSSSPWRFGSRLMAVTFSAEPEPRLGEPRLLFEGPYNLCDDGGPSYAVSPDGQHFLMVSYDEDPYSTDELVVVLNWFEELRRLAPPGEN